MQTVTEFETLPIIRIYNITVDGTGVFRGLSRNNGLRAGRPALELGLTSRQGMFHLSTASKPVLGLS